MKRRHFLHGDTALFEQATQEIKRLEARAKELRMIQAQERTLARVRELSEGACGSTERSEVGGQKTEIRDQRSEIRGQRGMKKAA